MRSFRQKNQVPPGGRFFYQTPDSKAQFQGPTLADVQRQVEEHYALNKMAIPGNLGALIEDFVCRHVDPGFCEGDAEGRPQARPVTIWHIVHATKLLFNRAFQSDFFVPRSEAERRASICARCPRNVAGICSGCHGMASRFASVLHSRTTSRDSSLHVCLACGCYLPAKVHVANKYLDDSRLPVEDVPDFCWRKQPAAVGKE